MTPIHQPKNIDEYIERQPENIASTLDLIKRTIEQETPDAEELISYQMPAFKYFGMLIWFGAFKNHYSIFVHPNILEAFKDDITAYKTTKSAINFLYSQEVPIRLIAEIVKFAAMENREKARLKKNK